MYFMRVAGGRAAGWGGWEEGGAGGAFATSSRPEQPANTRPPPYSFDSSAAWEQEFGVRALPRPKSWSCLFGLTLGGVC